MEAILSLQFLLSFSANWLFTNTDATNICTDSKCEYNFDIRHFRTMTYSKDNKAYNVELNGTRLQIVPNIFRLQELDENVGTFVNASDVITADGYPRHIITINDQFPGPTIEVMEGSQVVVHVTNHLLLEGTSIHWHGMLMHNTPFMDGVSYVTQCPILPHQKFTYRFKADPAGTHWYHAHMASQRIDGLFGFLIVHNRLPKLPEYSVSVMDWMHISATDIEIASPYSKSKPGTGQYHHADHNLDYSFDGSEVHGFFGALINGRGRHDAQSFPLAEFEINKGQRYRFRLANTGESHTFELSVDHHELLVVASDGKDVIPIRTQFLFIHAGETYDFELAANQPEGNYWLRVNTIRRGKGFYPTTDNIVQGVKAIIRYQDVSTKEDPTTSSRVCTQQSPCAVVNCPFDSFPPSFHKTCIGIDELRSIENQNTLAAEYGLGVNNEDVVELFYNFAYSIGSSINAHMYSEARTHMFQKDVGNYITPCDREKCKQNGCTCTHIDELPYNRTVQIVLSVYRPGGTTISSHPVHLHGHNFAVLKVGYPEQNTTTAHWTRHNRDIVCTSSDKPLCSTRSWATVRPPLNLDKPPIKDVVGVPARGYAVIRFRTMNPGFWFFHCHHDSHLMEGMTMVFNEAPGRHPIPPKNFPSCGDFAMGSDDYDDYINGMYAVDTNGRSGNGEINTNANVSASSGPLDIYTQEQRCALSNDIITLSTERATGLAFAFLLVGASLAFFPTAIIVCCILRRNNKLK